MKEESVFALVIGAGPVGMAAALDLNWRGVPTMLVNERLQTAHHPKCNHTSGRSMEYFRRIGISQIIRDAFIPTNAPGTGHYVTTFCGHELGRMPSLQPQLRDGKVVGGAASLRVTAEPAKFIAQPLLEQELKALLDASPVDVRFGCKAIAMEEGPEDVVVTVRYVETGKEQKIRAKYVIGSDGAGSFVRKALGVKLEGEDGSRMGRFMSGAMASYHIRSPNLLERSGRPLATLTYLFGHDMRGATFLQDGGTRWIFHYQVPQGVDPDSLEPREVIAKMIGDDEVEFEILSGGPWTGGQALYADRYQTRRVFLAGDAAHLVAPMGGTGMNTGIADAMNITWKIAAAFEGWAGPRLLETYEEERWPMGVRNSQFGLIYVRLHNSWELPEDLEAPGPEADAHRREFGRIVVEGDKGAYTAPGVHFGDRYESSTIIVPDGTPVPPDSYSVYAPSDRAGGRLPHYVTPDGRALQDALGKGYTLVNFSGDDASYVEALARQRNMPFRIVNLPRPDGDTGYTRNFVLARPDLFVAWSGDRLPADVGQMLDVVRGAVQIRPAPARDVRALTPVAP